MQIQNWIEAKGEIHLPSFASTCKWAVDLIDDATSLLTNWKVTGEKCDPITDIVRAITFFAPNLIFLQLFNHEQVLREFMGHEDSGAERDYSMSVPTAKKLIKAGNFSSSLIKHKIVLGFIDYHKKRYSEAFTSFSWVSPVIGYYRKMGNDSELLKTLDIAVMIYTTQCCSFINHPMLRDSFSMMVNWDGFGSDELEAGIMGKFFASCGLFYERAAISQATQAQTGEGLAMRLHKSHLNEMLRKYILATTCMHQDDPGLVSVYDRILWGLLLYGNIHLQTLWFFLTMKNQKALDLDYSPLHVCSDHDYRVFHTNELLEKYDNAWDMIDRSYDMRVHLNISDAESWNKEHGNMFLIPPICVKENHLVVLEDAPKSILKKDNDEYDTDIDYSMELIELWKNSYAAYNGEIPEIIK